MIDPATYNITIQQNATFSAVFQLKDGDGNPIDLTGYGVDAEVWTDGKGLKLADFVVTWVDRTNGKFSLSIPASVTATIGQSGMWDLLVTNPTGTKDYWLRGSATLQMGYSQ